jgi:hypothetical protein
MFLKKNTNEAPNAVKNQVNNVAYNAAKIGSMLLKYSIID